MPAEPARVLRDALRRLLLAHGTLDDHRRPCGTRLGLPHAHALLTLAEREEPVSVGALAESLAIDRTNVSRLCVRMEQLGEVVRTPDAGDKRSVQVALTQIGRTVAAGVDQTSTQHFEAVVAALGTQTSGVTAALDVLAKALTAVRPQPRSESSP